MRASWATWVSCALVSLASAPVAAAQQVEAPRFNVADDTVSVRPAWRPLRVAKWSLLAASGAAAVYGFLENREADREYESIERICMEDPDACATQPNSDVYVDAALEARYRSVVERDDRAQLALIAGQVGLAASILMFILDLSEDGAPDDIPYDPRPLRLGVKPDKLELGVQLPLR